MCTFSSAVQPECAVVLRVFCLHVYKCVLNRLTFLLSSWISAWVTACLIWSCRQREKQSHFFKKQINITQIKLGKTVNKRLNKIMTFNIQIIYITCTSLNLWASFSGSSSTGDSISWFSARSKTSIEFGNIGLISSSSSVAYSPVCR